jgi:hypothetical protein
MSATNDPVEYWLKQCGTTENRYTCQKAVTKEMLQAGREKKITPALIFNSTIFPWCHKNNYAIHVTAVGHKHRSPFYKEDTDTEYRDTSIFGGGRQGGTLWRAESTNDEYMKSFSDHKSNRLDKKNKNMQSSSQSSIKSASKNDLNR